MSTINFKCVFVTVIMLIKIIGDVSSAKILFFYAGGTYSHKNGIWPLVTALADRGHNVTLISPFAKRPTENSLVNDLSPKFLQGRMQEFLKTDKLQARKDGQETALWLSVPAMGAKFCTAIVNNAKNDSVLRTVLYDSSFDLMVINAVFAECGIMWAHYHQTRFMIASSTSIFPWLYDIYGLPTETSWLPDIALQVHTNPMPFYDRMKNYLWTLYFHYLRVTQTHVAMEKLMKETFKMESVPNFLDLEREASLVMVNTFPGTEFARALPPFFVHIGGMQCWQPQKKLPEEFQAYMDGAEDGVILLAFGSTLDFHNLPQSFQEIFFDAMKQFPNIRFIWKWSGEKLQNAPKNLLMKKWLPQMDILQHPKLLAFVTHCGLNSVMEATYSGVPLIAMPFFGDQDYNANHINIYELGIFVEPAELNSHGLAFAIREITLDPKYKRNMLGASRIFKDRQMNPIDAGVFWTEFVLRNANTSVLKPLNYHQPWWQRRLLDVSAALLLVFVALFTILIVITRKTIQLLSHFVRVDNVQPGKLKVESEKKMN